MAQESTLSTRFYGVASIVLAGIAVALAFLMLAQIAWGWAVGFALLCMAGMGAIIYAYCTKCPCKACCPHVLLGKIAEQFPREPGPYSIVEQAAVVVALLLILGLPQLWLWRSVAAGVAFWVLNAIAVTQILIFVCGTCPNTYCPVGQKRTPGVKHNSTPL